MLYKGDPNRLSYQRSIALPIKRCGTLLNTTCKDEKNTQPLIPYNLPRIYANEIEVCLKQNSLRIFPQRQTDACSKLQLSQNLSPFLWNIATYVFSVIRDGINLGSKLKPGSHRNLYSWHTVQPKRDRIYASIHGERYILLNVCAWGYTPWNVRRSNMHALTLCINLINYLSIHL